MTSLDDHVLAMAPPLVHVGGDWREGAARAVFPVEDPATRSPLTEVADGEVADAVAALDAAVAALPVTRALSPRERSDLLLRVHDLLLAREGELGLLMTLEMGKPLTESRAEVRYAAEFFRYYAAEAERVAGRWSRSPLGDGDLLTRYGPVGPCLLVTPWNFPLAMAARKVAPALAAGCTVVLKPAQLTPLSALALAALVTEAGAPPGALNVVPTSRSAEVVEALLADDRLRKLSFTGSTGVGRRLLSLASRHVVRTSMELGGNAPFLVFEDADLDEAVAGAVVAKIRNGGQACTAANRYLVHTSVLPEFSGRLAERLAGLEVGPGRATGTEVGPLIDGAAREKALDLVEDATSLGARLLTGGEPVPGPGYFLRPTVLADVPLTARCLHEEIFAPVAPVVAFETDEEAVRLANATEYGLAAYAYTRDVDRALGLADALEVGMLGLNQGTVSNPAAPFGGVKASGLGREGGPEGLLEYQQQTYVGLRRSL